VPVLAPEGFLSEEELALLDAALPPDEVSDSGASEEAEWTQ
jgi:hypothetical protein